MDNLTDILIPLILSSTIHTFGHSIAGNNVNVPVKVDWKNRVEYWNTPDNKKSIYINSGGFLYQDVLANILGDDFRKAAGLYKLGYLSKLTLPKSNTGVTIEGDIGSVKRLSGNKAYPTMVLVDALSDIAFDNDKRSISTKVTEDGVPVVLYNFKF